MGRKTKCTKLPPDRRTRGGPGPVVPGPALSREISETMGGVSDVRRRRGRGRDIKTTLVINTGSSSVKYGVFCMPEENRIACGLVESIGDRDRPAQCRQIGRDGVVYQAAIGCGGHGEAILHIFRLLADPGKGVLASLAEIDAVGHRVVHGGSIFSKPTMVCPAVLDSLEGIADLAPLHMPLNIEGIRACMEHLPGTRQVACFDTAFFHGMPRSSALYPIPLAWSEDYGVRRYGFHGISYEYLAGETERVLSRPLDELKIIMTHLGNGCSITAMDRGVVKETSMGFTPLEGLMMGTRSGSVDPAVFPYMMARTGMSAQDILAVLNTESGLAGVSGISRDMREIVAFMKNGSERAGLAFDMFVHILRKYIGAYAFCMGGLDAVVFSGGIGENAPEVREAALQGLTFAGIRVDGAKNRMTTGSRPGMIHRDGSAVQLLVIPANEERMIARSVFAHANAGPATP